MEHSVRILSIKQVTHNVRSYRLEKPADYHFIPGQATEVSIDMPDWKEEKRPFTFTSLNSEPTLEFTIKSYTDHHGVTAQLSKLSEDDRLIVRDIWGAIAYSGEGYFIAGGAGITPFIAILRQLRKDGKLANNKLIFSNRTAQDIILQDELTDILGDNALYILSEDEKEGYYSGHIDEDFLRTNITDFSKHFYICGPDPMIQAISDCLKKLGADSEAVVFEK